MVYLPRWLEDALDGQAWTLAGASALALLCAAPVLWQRTAEGDAGAALRAPPTLPATPGAAASVSAATLDVADCAIASVSIVQSDGVLGRVCAGPGAAVEWLPDGVQRLALSDATGRRLAIDLDTRGAVRRIALDERLHCNLAACRGVTTRVREGMRSVTFSGTVLTAGASLRAMSTLNGSVSVPAL